MKLIITEKPLAAEKIAEILSKNQARKQLLDKTPVWRWKESEEIAVIPMKGHILDVDFPDGCQNWSQTDLTKLADAPVEYKPSQIGHVNALTKYAKQANSAILATDYDVEGESIALEACNILRAANSMIKIKRAVFSAISPKDLEKAFSNLIELNIPMAESANARREIDLIWGAILTRYVSLTANRLGRDFLSVGRVQTPMLGLCVSREKEILAFKSQPFWVVSILCNKNGQLFPAVYAEEKLFDKAKAQKTADIKQKEANVNDVECKKSEIKPPAPFNTTEFLRAASSLGFQPVSAMSIAEKLYMEGYTSYPRVDNTIYPPTLDVKEVLNKLEKSEFGPLAKKILSQKKIEPTRGKMESTDHPPIYPVEVADKKKLSPPEWKIYELIVRRFFATLAPASEIETVKAVLDVEGKKFIGRGKTVLKQGWREFYPYSEVEETILPKLEKGEKIHIDKAECKEDKTKPKPRYTPSALLKLLETLHLGTKATRAEILQKLIDRGYLEGKQNFTPSAIAFAVIDALEQYAKDVTRPEMTANLEKEMEEVGKAKKTKEEVVEESRRILHAILKDLLAKRPEISQKLRGAMINENVVCACKCGGVLRIIETSRGTRFIGCSNWREGCKNSFPLPAKGKIRVISGELCKVCSLPVVEITVFKHRPYYMCINHKCESKANWGKKKEAKETPKEKAEVNQAAESAGLAGKGVKTPALKKPRKPRAKKAEKKE